MGNPIGRKLRASTVTIVTRNWIPKPLAEVLNRGSESKGGESRKKRKKVGQMAFNGDSEKGF